MSTARDDVITVLGDISSRDRHYERYVATGDQADIARELWHCWIRDTYRPHSGDYQAEFSQEERDKLEMFTQFFRVRLRELPGRFESLMTDVHWAGIAEYAALVLEQLAEASNEGEDSEA